MKSLRAVQSDLALAVGSDKAAGICKQLANFRPGLPVIIGIHGLWNNAKALAAATAELEANVLLVSWPEKEGGRELATLTTERILGQYGAIARAVHAWRGEKPWGFGHSYGGLIVLRLNSQGLLGRAVAVCPAPPAGCISFNPADLCTVGRSNWDAIKQLWAARPILISQDNFSYAFAGNSTPAEQREAYSSFAVPESPKLFQEIFFRPFANRVDWSNQKGGRILLVAACDDRICPPRQIRKICRKFREAGADVQYRLLSGTHGILNEAGGKEVLRVSNEWFRSAVPIPRRKAG